MSTAPSNSYAMDRSTAEILSAIDKQTLLMNNNNTTDLLYKTNKNIYDSTALLAGKIHGVNNHLSNSTADVKSTIENHTLGLRNAIEQNAMLDMYSTERNAGILSSAIERTGAQNVSNTDRNANLLGSAIDRNGAQNDSTIYRTNALTMSAIERANAEARLTTVVTDSASRQSANDSARDIIKQLNYNNTTTNEASQHQFNDIKSSIIQTAQETRHIINTGNANIRNEIQVGDILMQRQNNAHYTSLLLEGQKSKELMNMKLADAKYEALSNSAYITNKLSASTADAKYEALVNQNILSTQMMKQGCEIKGTIDQRAMDTKDLITNLDTNRLRDDLISSRDENILYKITDRFEYGHGRHGRHGGYYGW